MFNSYTPLIYFMLLVIIGNFILLKLYIGVLLNSFSNAKSELEEKVEVKINR
jgi:hypothetical protein